MKNPRVSLGLAFLIVFCTWYFSLRPAHPILISDQTEVTSLETEIATVEAAARIEPRLRAERITLARRLASTRSVEPGRAQALLLVGLTGVAQSSGVQIVSIQQRGSAGPFVPVPVGGPSPTPAPSPGVTPDAAAPPAVTATGVRIPFVVQTEGNLDGLLRFIDGLGNLPIAVNVTDVSFTQTKVLTASVSLEVVLPDSHQLAEAKSV